ncbi:MAG TPA: helix-turn-helix domain-containing protein [Kofleriaceae bacterium]|nr:helix-turn-helix domain-containing protein [Kofleriaceae bacterium]
MKESKRKQLEAAGWRVGSVSEFLGWSDVESLLVDLRLALSQALKERRTRLRLSQRDLAERIKSSQSRIAKMEAADPEVSFELLLRGFIAMGATRQDVADVFDAPLPAAKGKTRQKSTTSHRESSRKLVSAS